MRDPFAHRVEHSFHLDAYNLLVDHDVLSGRYHEIGRSGYRTQSVHKEWPSTEIFSLKDGTPRRQSYDLGILAPESIHAATLDDFTSGRISAAIAVELGLDYADSHLLGDIHKLTRNPVALGYIVHFSRKRTRRSTQVEQAILRRPDKIKTAFVHLDVKTGDGTYKRIFDSQIRPWRYTPDAPSS